MKGEVQKCIDAGLTHLHVDVFDGVFLDSPHALTFGPRMVEAIHQRFIDQQLTLDIHLCVDRPARYVKAMAEAGATRIIFQWEAMGNKDENGACSDSLSAAIELASAITSFGMKCGVSINPETPVSTIYPLLDTGFVDLVDILAVEPGFGGQIFNPVALQKIVELRQWRNTQAKESGTYLAILVDGGINLKTSQSVLDAGADILVAGTALFRHPRGFPDAVKELL